MQSHRLRRGLVLAGVVVFLVALFTAWQAWHVRSSLQDAAVELTAVKDTLAGGETAQAQERLAAAQDSAGSAHLHSRGPVWWTASKLPWLGDDVTAVRTVAEVADQLSSQTLPDVVALGGSLSPDTLSPEGGRVPLRPLRQAHPVLQAAAGDLSAAQEEVGTLETESLVGPLKAPVLDLQSKLTEAADLAGVAAEVTSVLPSMLGSDGPRHYLLVAQNNAEVRATGGIPGSIALIRADGGEVELLEQRAVSADGWGAFESPVLPLTPEEEALYTDRLATWALDANFTPDFPRTAQLLQRAWQLREGQRVDGVVSVDPVALSYLMRGTGPITLANGRQVDAGSVVPYLLNGVYQETPDPRAQDALFGTVARTFFDTLMTGRGDPRKLVDGLAQGVREQRVLVWSQHQAEQRVLADDVIAGVLAGPRTGGDEPATVGVYLNDSGSDKMTFFLRHRVDLVPQVCNGDGSQVATVRVRLENVGPPGGEGLTEYVTGAEGQGYARGDMRLTTFVYSPLGGQVTDASLDGEEVPISTYPHQGHEVGAITVDVAPGERRVLDLTVRTGDDSQEELALRVTPGVTSTGIGRIGPSACA